MRTIQVKVYKFSELSEKAKERAKYDQKSVFGFSREKEAMASIEGLAASFFGKLKDWSIDFANCSHSSAVFRMPSGWGPGDIKEVLDTLGSYDPKTLQGLGDCKLTGYYLDESAIDGFRIAFMRDGIEDLDELMEAAFRSWLKAAQEDYEDEYSDATFSETADANEYEYYEDGRLAK